MPYPFYFCFIPLRLVLELQNDFHLMSTSLGHIGNSIIFVELYNTFRTSHTFPVKLQFLREICCAGMVEMIWGRVAIDSILFCRLSQVV